MLRLSTVLITVCALLASCIVNVPPPPPPELIVPRPNVVLGAPAPGEGTVLIDSTPEPTDVLTFEGSSARTICQTPCEVHLPQGLHELRFVDQASGEFRGDGRITVGAVPTAYRYATGRQDISYVGIGVGGTLMVTGLSLLLPAALTGENTLTGVAVGMTVLGALGYYLLRPHIQKGTGVQWTPPPPQTPTQGAPGADLR